MSGQPLLGQFRPTSFCASLALCLLGAMGPMSAAAQVADGEVIEAQLSEQGSSERINNSGKLRMLSQRIVATSCYVQSGIDTEASRAMLESATAEFALITDALEFGNEDLGIIGAEERRRTLAGISKLRELWTPVYDIANKIIDGEGSLEDINAMSVQSAALLDIAQRLVVEITGQYANPNAIRQTDAFAIDIAGRQRMLAQRVSKNVCLATAGVNVEDSQAELAQAAQNFGAALDALRNGAQAVGVPPPPTTEISDGLNAIYDSWQSVLPIIDAAQSSADISADDLSIIFNTGNALTGGMNSAVGLYVEASKFAT